MKIFNILIAAIMGVLLLNCADDNPDAGGSTAYPIAGEWLVTYSVDDGSGGFEDVGGGQYQLNLYNTAAGDSLWIDDSKDPFWIYKIKAAFDKKSRTFSTQGSKSVALYQGDPYDIIVKVTNGKVILDGGMSSSNHVTDSIYMEIEYEDDPGTIYYAFGHRLNSEH